MGSKGIQGETGIQGLEGDSLDFTLVNSVNGIIKKVNIKNEENLYSGSTSKYIAANKIISGQPLRLKIEDSGNIYAADINFDTRQWELIGIACHDCEMGESINVLKNGFITCNFKKLTIINQ